MTQAAQRTRDVSRSNVVDEVALATGDTAVLHDWLREELLRDGPAALQQLQVQGQQWMHDMGVTFSPLLRPVADHVVPFDPYPRIIGQDDWQRLQLGVQQRLTIWNAFLKDIYSTQEVLRADVIPYHWIYDDPSFHRGAVEVPVPGSVFAHVAAFDLLRLPDGSWVVSRDMIAHTTGAVYAVQARNVLQHVMPSLLEAASLHAVDDYPTLLLEHLRRYAPGITSELRVALCSGGPGDHAYYEHSSLARQMGVPLLQGADLTVLNSRVYFKTIGGLEPIDVLYRRLDEDRTDPLEFGGGGRSGVAGLMNCVRKGTVAVANALGAGLGENRAIAAMMPRLARFYLNEPLLLPTCERFLLEDPDQREFVRANPEQYLISPLHSRAPIHAGLSEPDGQAVDAERQWDRVMQAPGRYVAEPQLPFNLLPSVTPQGLAMRHAGLRLFAFGGEEGAVVPCALTRYSPQANSRVISSGLGGGIKDTWILKSVADEEESSPIVVRSGQRRLRLGSRTGDSLYWIGRYSERAENLTRALQVVQTDSLSHHSANSPVEREPLFEALAQLGGHSPRFYLRARLPRGFTVARHVLYASGNSNSVLQCLENCLGNARQIRESIPPEIWLIVSRLPQLLGTAVRRGGRQEELKLRQALALEDSLLNQFDALTGAVEKNMVLGDSRYFWNLGVQVERALDTISVLRPVLIRRPDPRTGELTRNADHLDALLGMLASRYAYRSLYQARPTPEYVARLLLQDEHIPRSVLRCLRQLHQSLALVTTAGSASAPEATDEVPLRRCGELLSMVEFTDLRPFFQTGGSQRVPRLRRWLEELSVRLRALSEHIGDHYLHHQAFNILR